MDVSALVNRTGSLPSCCWMLISLVSIAGIEGSDDDALVTGEQDEELSRWEQEQIRKGINIPQLRKPRFLKMKRSRWEGFVTVVTVQTVSEPSSLISQRSQNWRALCIHKALRINCFKFSLCIKNGGRMSSFSNWYSAAASGSPLQRQSRVGRWGLGPALTQ